MVKSASRESTAEESLNLRVTIAGKTLPNPVGVASGTFGFGEEYASLMNLAVLGGQATLRQDSQRHPRG